MLLTTHYMEEAEVLCDRVAIMDHGQILEEGTVSEWSARQFKDRAVRFDDRGLRRRAALRHAVRLAVAQRTSEVLVTHRRPATIGDLEQLGGSAGVENEIDVRQGPTLEDVFLDLTGRALRD